MLSEPQESKPEDIGPAGLSFRFSRVLPRPLRGRRRDLFHDAPEGFRVFVGPELSGRLYEALVLCLAVVSRWLALCHGTSRWLRALAYSVSHREVRHG